MTKGLLFKRVMESSDDKRRTLVALLAIDPSSGYCLYKGSEFQEPHFDELLDGLIGQTAATFSITPEQATVALTDSVRSHVPALTFLRKFREGVEAYATEHPFDRDPEVSARKLSDEQKRIQGEASECFYRMDSLCEVFGSLSD